MDAYSYLTLSLIPLIPHSLYFLLFNTFSHFFLLLASLPSSYHKVIINIITLLSIFISFLFFLSFYIIEYSLKPFACNYFLLARLGDYSVSISILCFLFLCFSSSLFTQIKGCIFADE